MNTTIDTNKQRGYLDMQMPPIIIGAIIVIALVSLLTHPESTVAEPGIVHYVLLGVAFAAFALGFYTNKESVQVSESPFNKHVSPLFLAACVIGSLAYAIWKVYDTPHNILVIIFAAAIVVTIPVAIYLVLIQIKTGSR